MTTIKSPLILIVFVGTVWSINLDHRLASFGHKLNRIGSTASDTQSFLYLIGSNPSDSSSAKSARCLCKLGLGKLPLPIPLPVPVPVVTNPNMVNNNVAAFQQLPDGRTALYNNQGQIIGFLPAGTTAQNNG